MSDDDSTTDRVMDQDAMREATPDERTRAHAQLAELGIEMPVNTDDLGDDE